MEFNTRRYWWCYFDKESKKLYDQFCNLIMDDASGYLLDLGHIDERMNKLKEFSN